MKIRELSEESYPGNLGMMEMCKFYTIASDLEKSEMKSLIDKKQFKKAWELLQKVTGVTLH